MAQRPVFMTNNHQPYFEERIVEFKYYSGFAQSQCKKSIDSLHHAFSETFPGHRILEVSTKSGSQLGQMLSAFNLCLTYEDSKYTVEQLFQAGKEFARGGPYKDLLGKSGYEIKKDPRLTESGNIIGFDLFGEYFPTEPKTYFYDWLYAKALHENTALHEEIMSYDAFTDIAFNPQKSLNCQARTIAKYVSLVRNRLIEEALSSKEAFKKIIYESSEPIYVQESFF